MAEAACTCACVYVSVCMFEGEPETTDKTEAGTRKEDRCGVIFGIIIYTPVYHK